MNKLHTPVVGGAGSNGAIGKRLARALRPLALALSAIAILVPAAAGVVRTGAAVTVPNGYANIAQDDLRVASTAGMVRWMRVWDGQEWKFNPQWESLSQSWKNMTGSQTADTTLGSATGAGSGGTLVSSGGSGSDGGCWVWVDENWQPTAGTTTISGVPQAGPMMAVRTTPFNRTMGESRSDYAPAQRVSVDYASLCAGSSSSGASAVRDVEGIRRANELYLGEEGRYAFSNRAILEKRAIRQLPPASAASQYASLAAGSIALAPVVNQKGFRWIDKGGDWIDYDTQGLVAAWGDKNDNIVWMLRDSDGVLRGVVDANGRVVYSLHYTGDLITEVRDYAAGSNDQAHVVKYTYDTANRLTEVTDARGNLTKYEYDASNRIVRITDPEGRVEQLAYAGEMVKKRTTPDGAVTDYVFDYDDTNKQFVSKITGPETAAGRRVEDFTHNRVGKLVRVLTNGRPDIEVRYDTAARTRVETNARGFATRITNNEFDQVVEVVLPDGSTRKRVYSAQHLGLTETIDELGYKSQYQHDARGNLVRQVQAAGTPVERITEHTRNGLGQVVQVTRKGGTEANGTVTPDATWKIEYDALGQLKKTTDPEGAVRQYAYDHAGNLVSFTDPRGFTTRYQLDAGGNMIAAIDALGRTRTYQYDKVGNVVTITDARAKVVQSSYDAMNRHLRTVNAVGGVYRVQYNGQGLPVSETDEDGRTSIAEFDNFLRLSKQVDGMGNVTRFSYNLPDGSAAGALGSLQDPTEIAYPTFIQRQRYDQRERPTTDTVLNPNSQGTEGLVSGTEYTRRGEVQSQTDANGKTAFFVYNPLGQLTEWTDSLGNKTRGLYDLRGNLIQITDAKGNVNKFEFNRNDQMVKEVLPLGQATTYAFNEAGNLSERVSANGARLVLTYDGANRVTEARQYRQGNMLARTTTYTWDAEDNLQAWTDTDHERAQTSGNSRVFDDAGRKTAETVTYPGGYSLSYGYTYSPAGNKLEITWPDGMRIGYGYSAHNELQDVTIPGEGNLAVTAFKWLAPATVQLPGGAIQERTLDGMLNLEALRVKTAEQQTVLDLANTYGKVLELKTSARTDTAGGVSNGKSTTFKYDAATRLTEAASTAGAVFGNDTETFTLDALGNRIEHSKISGAWVYDANNRLVQRGSGAAATAYQYDAAGNLVQMTEPGNRITRYEYDTQNRLAQVTDGAGNLVARYGYDPLDRRIWREQFRARDGSALAQAKRSFYLYADEGLVAEATQDIALADDGSVAAGSSPALVTQYGLRPDAEFSSGVLFVKTRNSNGAASVAYYHNDGLGTPLQATDKAGRVVWAAVYDAYGRATITTPAASADAPTIESSLRLPGQFEDPETGLHYNYRRYYDPATGRYTTQDPLGIAGGNNKYRYAEANPVNLSDPTGECPMCAAYAVCVAECMLEDVAVNALTGDCNNFGDSAKGCAMSCVLGPLGRMGNWGKRAKDAACNFNSFPADTVVHVKPLGAADELAMTARSERKAISELKVGDEVLAFSEWKDKGGQARHDQRLSYEKVTDVFTSLKSHTLVHLTLANGQTLTATQGHPFRTTEGWRDAILLKKGGQLLLKGDPDAPAGKTVRILSVRTEQQVIRVFNIEVANAHTFFAGDDGQLVHNCGRGKGVEFPRKMNHDNHLANPDCVYCGVPTVRSQKPQPNRYNGDHKTSVKDGGGNDAGNLQTTCQACNLDKGGLSDDAYRQKKGL